MKKDLKNKLSEYLGKEIKDKDFINICEILLYRKSSPINITESIIKYYNLVGKTVNWKDIILLKDLNDFDFWDYYKDKIDWNELVCSRILNKNFIIKFKNIIRSEGLIEQVLMYQKYCDIFLDDLFGKDRILANLSTYRNILFTTDIGKDWFIGYIVLRNVKLEIGKKYNIKNLSILIFQLDLLSNHIYKDNNDIFTVYKVRVWYKDIGNDLKNINVSKFDILKEYKYSDKYNFRKR